MAVVMKAGRELDALVAERVTGLSANERRPANCPTCGAQVPDSYFHFVQRWRDWTCMNGHYIPKLKDYSTDIAAAWEVVEKLKGLPYTVGDVDDHEGIEVRLTWCRGRREWTCRVWDERLIEESAPTAPHAICLAALKAAETPRTPPDAKTEGEGSPSDPARVSFPREDMDA